MTTESPGETGKTNADGQIPWVAPDYSTAPPTPRAVASDPSLPAWGDSQEHTASLGLAHGGAAPTVAISPVAPQQTLPPTPAGPVTLGIVEVVPNPESMASAGGSYPLGGYPQPTSAEGGVPPRPPLGVPIGPASTPPAVGPAGSVEGTRQTRSVGMAVLATVMVTSAVAALLFFGYRSRIGSTTQSADRPSVSLGDGPLDIQELLARVGPAVVTITTGSGNTVATGSGVVIDDEGLILTNAHVIAASNEMQVVFSDGSTAAAELVGSFPDRDVALIRPKEPRATMPAPLGISANLRVGDDVVAIGNALNLGLQPTVTKGIVSAMHRRLDAEGEHLENLIQTDAAINEGNSGGPLLNAYGEVVGINTAIIQDSQNLGFALEIDSLKPLIADLKAGRGTVTSETAFLGVSTIPVDVVEQAVLDQYNVVTTDGAFVSEVSPGSGAAVAGLRSGDVIVAMDGKDIVTNTDVGDVVAAHQGGDTIEITLEREGAERTVSVTLGTRGG